MGTPDFALAPLNALIAVGNDIARVYTQPARPSGRGQQTRPSPVERAVREKGLPVRAPQSLRDADEQKSFAGLNLDAAIVVAYGLILPKAILEAPRLGCFNVHASLLPRWRGAAPIQRAIMAGDTETGITIMKMDEGLDTGPILLAESIATGAREAAGALRDRLSTLGARLIIKALENVTAGALTPHAQPQEGVTYAKKIEPAELRLDWTKPALELDRLARALSPVPGAWCQMKGERVKILEAEPAEGKGAPGEVLDGLTVACGDGALKLLKLQRAGRSPQASGEFLRGFPLAPGERLQ